MTFVQLKHEAHAEIEAKYVCAHPERELRHRVLKNKSESYVSQCVHCGHTSSTPVAKKKALAMSGRQPIPEYDYHISDLRRAAKSAEYKEAYLRLKPHFRAEYESHLRSAQWQDLRQLVRIRANCCCEICEVQPVEEVHHLTYDRLGHEKLEDLLGLCRNCHAAVHSF